MTLPPAPGPAKLRRFPAFEAAKCHRTWSGHYEQNELDGNPVIGRWSRVPNLYTVAGFSGHGMMHAPAAARAIAELVVHVRYQSLDLSRLGYERVERNEPYREEGFSKIVIPAKAGIHVATVKVKMDPRLCGDDGICGNLSLFLALYICCIYCVTYEGRVRFFEGKKGRDHAAKGQDAYFDIYRQCGAGRVSSTRQQGGHRLPDHDERGASPVSIGGGAPVDRSNIAPRAAGGASQISTWSRSS
jgi:hypothetical protein